MSAAKPAWRQVFDKVERAVGRPLEEAVASPTYADVIAIGIKTQRAVNGILGRAVGGAVGNVLRVINVPTRDDVLRLNRQLAVLSAEVRTLGAAQQAARGPARPQQARRAPDDPPVLTAKEGDHDG